MFPLLPAQVAEERGLWEVHIPHDAAETDTETLFWSIGLLIRILWELEAALPSTAAVDMSVQMFVTGGVSFYQLQLCL